MAQAVFGSPLLAVEGETASLTTTASYLLLKPGFHEVKLYSASQWRLALSPSFLHVLFYDKSADTYTEYRKQATDRDNATHVPLDAMAIDDFLYLGTTEAVLGYYFNMDGSNFNEVAAALDMEYCSTAVASEATLAFTDVGGSDSDGTDVGGDTLKQDGVYTWGTTPTPDLTWKRSTLGTYEAPLYSKCYWIRFKPSSVLSATVDIIDLIPVYINSDYAYMEAGIEYQFSLNVAKVGGFVLKGTASQTLDVSWVKH